VSSFSKVLVTVTYAGDTAPFARALQAELDALVDRGGAARAALDVPVEGYEAEVVGPIRNEDRFRAMLSLWEPVGNADRFGLSLPDGTRVVGVYAVDEVVQKDYERTWERGAASPGVKLVCAINRRPDMTHEAFLAHWRNNHGPLAVAHQPGFWHYVQNHIQGWLTEDTPFLDGIGELHFRTTGDIFAGMYDSEEGERLIVEDTERFLDNDRNMVLPTKELLVP
jgi:hypothetical protein